MASLIFACLSCCCGSRHQGKPSFLSAPTVPKHKRHQHNPPTVIPNPGMVSRTTNTATIVGSGPPRAKTSQDYTFEVLKTENERRVRQLAEAGVMDVPHGVLSKEVGTPELAPVYGDVMGHGGGRWSMERGEVPVEGVHDTGGDTGEELGYVENSTEPSVPRERSSSLERVHISSGRGERTRLPTEGVP